MFARGAVASGATPDVGAAAWGAALASTELPVAYSLGKTPRFRLTFAAALPAGMAGEAELADLVLTERLSVAAVRSRLDRHLPDGHRLVDLYDIWLGAPTLIVQLAAADYRVAVRGATVGELGDACARLMATATLERSRRKGDGRTVPYDLRPLLLRLSVVDAAVGTADDVTLLMRLGHPQDGPAGRPEEVVLALAESLKRPLEPGPIVRERLLTNDMLEDP